VVKNDGGSSCVDCRGTGGAIGHGKNGTAVRKATEKCPCCHENEGYGCFWFGVPVATCTCSAGSRPGTFGLSSGSVLQQKGKNTEADRHITTITALRTVRYCTDEQLNSSADTYAHQVNLSSLDLQTVNVSSADCRHFLTAAK
jgi:hypothetical protein